MMNDTPLFNAVLKYKSLKPVVMHMPGHKMGKGLPDMFKENMAYIDVTEIEGTDDLHYPEGPIKQAQELAAKAFGAQHTFFLVNGSTCGILAAINSICQKGDVIITGRDCHVSVINAISLAGARAVFVSPEINDEFGISTFYNPEKIEKAIADNPDCKGIIITSPNYFGICSDIRSISEIAHKYNKILIVDEAHGAHLGFNHRVPKSSMSLGADISVQSAHKTLPALNQGAFLHIGSDKIEVPKIQHFLRCFQTTSPSYVIMSSLDLVRSIMQNEGERRLDALINDIKAFEEIIKQRTSFKLLEKSDLSMNKADKDATRIVLNTTETGISGYEVDLMLKRKYNIYSECVYLDNIVFIATISDEASVFARLSDALTEISEGFAENNTFSKAEHKSIIRNIINQKQRLKEAYHYKPFEIPYLGYIAGKETELSKCAGEMAATNIIPYPPGVPILVCGEVITPEAINIAEAYINAGMSVNGIREGKFIRIVLK